MKIGIAGIGGIGSNAAEMLVRTGVRHLKIVDFDKIELSNLNRQFYFKDQVSEYKIDALENNLKYIVPNIVIEKEILRLNEENLYNTFKDCSIIVEGFDNPEYKRILIEVFGNSDKLIVSASGIAGYNLENVKIKKFGKNCYIVGDFVSDFKEKKVYAPMVKYVSAIMSNIVLKEGGFYK